MTRKESSRDRSKSARQRFEEKVARILERFKNTPDVPALDQYVSGINPPNYGIVDDEGGYGEIDRKREKPAFIRRDEEGWNHED